MGDAQEKINAEDLRQMLAAGGARLLGDLLGEPNVKTACLDTLAGLGCRPPANHVVFFCLAKATLGTGSLLGTAAASRIEEWLFKIPAVRTLVVRLLALNRQEQDRERLRQLVLRELHAPDGTAEAQEADDVTPFEVVVALYQKKKLEGLTGEFREMFDDLRQAVADVLADIDRRDNEPILRWSIQHGPVSERSIADTLRYNSGQYAFKGREAEFDFLERFLGDRTSVGPLARFQWLLITGPGGEGKTRLAFEFSRHATNHLGWYIGKLEHDALKKFDASRWLPRRPTCIVIDYPAQLPELVSALLVALQKRSDEFDWPIRVLLMEREAEGDWFRRLLPEGTGSTTVREHAFSYDGERLEKGWMLPPMRPRAVIEVMEERFRDGDIPPPEQGLLLTAASQIDPRMMEIGSQRIPIPRPLFAMAAAEALLLARREPASDYLALIAMLNREEVLKRLINRDRDQRWRKAGGGDDANTLDVHENLFALATVCLGLSLSALRTAGSVSDYLPSMKPREALPLDASLLAAMCGNTGDYVPGLEPDILGEFFVLEKLEELARRDPDAAQAFRDAAFHLGGDDASTFVLRCLRDFPARIHAMEFLAPAARAGRSAAFPFTRLCVDLAAILGERGDWQGADAMLARLDALRGAFPDDREMALEEAKVAVNISNRSGKQASQMGDWSRVDLMFSRFDNLRSSFPGDRELVLTEVKAAVNICNSAGSEASRTADWSRADSMMARVDALRGLFQDDPEFALEEAKAVVNICNGAGHAASRTGDWSRVDSLFARLDKLRGTYADDQEIALAEAKAAVNICGGSESKDTQPPSWSRVNAMLMRLDALRLAFPDDREIALEEAKAAVNVCSVANEEVEQTGDWSRVDAMVARIDALRLLFPDDKETALEEAKALVNVSSCAGSQTSEAIDWSRLNAAFARLDGLRKAFPDDRAIGLREARVAFNASGMAGNEAAQTGDWSRVEALMGRLGVLCETFPVDREITLEQAKTAVNLSNGVWLDASRTGNWSRAGAIEGLCDRIADRFIEDEEVSSIAAVPFMQGYLARRVTSRPLDEEFTVAAVMAAMLVLRNPNAAIVEQFASRVLAVIKDAHVQLPDNQQIAETYRSCEEAGVDFGDVSDVSSFRLR